ncbi:MAG: 50S ribosomal protein L23 [Saprospiraceae bacterium]|jgi:large subunit ribosomal protein L23|nr:50S ribosomal protein L23 [Saprospiraceae bacterium]HRD80876.1 50S ribosomal protein L23 [Saprospiraceae bacterium]HRF40614.1 50S ribosomal protein L23 [Saprospiraceae bacterium]HRJ15685.1 50S ribosomal protein L23 [Saprospiraceae bacterium]HRK83210.1 50S ribosomal protein L23 [Saprospiraceae bacterium]
MGKIVLVKPILTEKADALSEKLSQYTFIVDRKVNKVEIRKAVEAMYNVAVDSVNTAVIPGKAKNRNTKKGVVRGQKAAYKKAIVTLAKGEEIDLFGNI